MLFRMKEKVGSHSDVNSKGELVTYKSGDVIETNVDLAKAFPEKFERVRVGGETPPLPENIKKSPRLENIDTPKEEKSDIQKAAEKGAKDVIPPAEEPEDEDDDEDDEEKVPLGKDVTEKFPGTEEEKLKVFYKKGKGFFVTTAADPFTALNEKKLKKAKVEIFIDEFLDSVDEDEE